MAHALPNMTALRRDWLQHLARVGVDSGEGQGRVPCDCKRLGWTEWAYHDTARGDVVGQAEFLARHERGSALRYGKIVGEQITDAGRAAMRDL